MGCNVGKELDDSIKVNNFSPLNNQVNGSSILFNQNKSKSLTSPEINADNTKDQLFPNKAAKYKTKIDSRVTAKYDVKALVGKGSFSDVLRVESKTTREPFAVKVLKVTNEQEKELLDSELSVLRNLSEHPNIIKLQEVIISKETTYLVMELATGGELYDKIKSRGYLDEKYCCNISQMLLDGLAYLHAIGITHRDLKPENLLFYHPGNDSRIIITDFGFSKINYNPLDNSPFSTWCGTPEYIAPELLSKIPYNNKVDIWAMGVIIYVMLSGHLPFSGNTTPKLFKQIMTGQYSYSKDVWDKVSPLAKSFIDRLIIVEPHRRLDCLSALKHDWLKSYPPLHPLVTVKLLRNKQISRIKSPLVKSNDHVVLPMKQLSAPEVASYADNIKTQNIITNGLVLPFSGDFQAQVISKDKILEDNASSISPSNIDSILATEDTDSTISNLALINQLHLKYNIPSNVDFNYTFDNNIKLPVQMGGNNNIILPKGSSMKEQKLNFHEQFEVIAEESEDEVEGNTKALDLNKLNRLYSKSNNESIISSGSMKSAHIPIETNLRSSYIEKVGVWLNEENNDISVEYRRPNNINMQETSQQSLMSQQSNSFKSNFTSLTAASDQSQTGSSFNRFLLPTHSQKHNADKHVTSSNKSIDNMIRNRSLLSGTPPGGWSNTVSGYETDLYPSNSYTSSTAPLQQQFNFGRKNANTVL